MTKRREPQRGRYTPRAETVDVQVSAVVGWWDPETGEDVWTDLLTGEEHREAR
jgi:hypothetical protein